MSLFKMVFVREDHDTHNRPPTMNINAVSDVEGNWKSID